MCIAHTKVRTSSPHPSMTVKKMFAFAVALCFIAGATCQTTYFNPAMQLNKNLDATPDGPYRVGYKTSKNFDPNGYHSNETYNEFGQLFPTLNKHIGRNIGYDHFYPVLTSIHNCNPPGTYWSTNVPFWTAVNITVGDLCENAPLANDKRHPIIMAANGFQDGSNEYFGWLLKLATYGFYIKAVQWHWGDEVLHAYNDRFLIITERVKDIVNGLNDLLAADCEDLPYLDTSRIGCMGHSYGGTTCLDLNIAAYSNRPDPRFTFILSLDASGYAFTYEQLQSLNIMLLGLYAENDVEDQGAIRFRNANQHPVNFPIVMRNMSHQQFQLENCAQSLLAIATGQVNTVPAAVPWKFPGNMFSRWCTLPSLWKNPNLMAPVQTVYNTGIYWLVSFLKAFVNANTQEALQYKARFTLQNVTAFQASANPNVYSPFDFLTAHKCGNLNWTGVPTSLPITLSSATSLTPVELTRTEGKVYTYYDGEVVSLFSGSYLVTPGIYSDCAPSCPFFGTTGTDANNKPTVTVDQPDRFVQAANPQCGCYNQPNQC